MAFENPGAGAPDYHPCRYGKSKLLFRGPRRKLEGNYCIAIGGTETYGKFVEEPFPVLLEQALGMPVVNFGYVNAGTDVFLNEPTIVDACSKSKVTIIQLVGAQNMSNRFYAVHPRRNDRFLRASAIMKTLFREVDFTEFHFTRHMLTALKSRAPDKFAMIEAELKEAWVARMDALLRKIEGRKLLIWLEDHRPRDRIVAGIGPEPALVDRKMVTAIAGDADEMVRVRLSDEARVSGTEGMRFAPLDEPMAAELPGPAVHSEIAAAVLPALRKLI
jgi:hypothetical protein